MDERKLPEKAREVVRDCVFLKRSGPAGQFAGVWGGPGIVPAPEGPFRHWVSVDCRFLPAGLGPSVGVLSVYANEDDFESGAAVHDAGAELSGPARSRLFAHPARSFPPPEAVAAEGDKAYVRLWQANCPLFTEEAAAVLGGWHFPWPDGDWEELRDRTLLVWTIDESEPWVEAWGGPSGFQVIQRVT